MTIKVIHLTEGSVWAGMEAHLINLLPGLSQCSDIKVECVTFHEGLLSKRLDSKGVKTIVCSRRTKYDFSLFFHLIRLLRKKRPHILHMHGYLAIFFGIPAAFIARVSVKVVTLHAKGEGEKEGKLLPSKMNVYLWLAYFLIKMSKTYCVAVSNDVYSRHVNFRGLSTKMMKVIHNGISIQDVQNHRPSISRIDMNISDSSYIVGMVGRLDENKGHIYFLKAAKKILCKRKDIHFIIIGNGPTEIRLKEFCSINQLNSHVHFLGFKENVLDYLSLMDVMVIASMHEGIPYVLLEAMAKGVAIIATDVGGLPEVIKNGFNGLLVLPKDPIAIGKSISALIEDEELRKSLIKNSADILNSHFSQQAMVQSTLQFYKEVTVKR